MELVHPLVGVGEGVGVAETVTLLILRTCVGRANEGIFSPNTTVIRLIAINATIAV